MSHALENLAESLIKAIRLRPPGGIWQFITGATSDPFSGGTGVELWTDQAALRRACILAYQIVPQTLEGVPLDDVRSLLQRSLERDFSRFVTRVFPVAAKETLWELTVETDVTAIAASIDREIAAMAAQKLWLVPAWRLRVDSGLDSGDWIVARGGGPHSAALDVLTLPHGLNGLVFPPIPLGGRQHPVTDNDAWLGVRAREPTQALSRLAQLFGAISMAFDPVKSRTFSGEEFPEGLFAIDSQGRPTFRTHGPQFPPVMGGATLSADQVSWIGRLLNHPSRTQELRLRILTCLEYVAAGWQPAGRLGFVHNAIAFDALFGVNKQVTKSIVAGVTKNAPGIADIEKRIRSLLQMRNLLLHGSAASVEQTAEYIGYWNSYDVDPHRDQIHILRTCLHSLNP